MERKVFELVQVGNGYFVKKHPNKVMPKDTNITKYFVFDGKIFSDMSLPDGRHMVMIQHVWDDGDIMKSGFEYSDGIARTGFNPLQIVGFYDYPVPPATLADDLHEFLKIYYHSVPESPGK